MINNSREKIIIILKITILSILIGIFPSFLQSQVCNPHSYDYNYIDGIIESWKPFTNIHFKINEDMGGINGTTQNDWINAITNAASTWNLAGSEFRFIYDGTTSENWGDDTPLYFDNIIGWFINWDNTTPAYTLEYYYINGQINQVTTWFNQGLININWSTTSYPTNNDMDIQSVATHELGHWFSLIDETYTEDTSNVMWILQPTGSISKRILSQDDKFGVQSLYPVTISNQSLTENRSVFEKWNGAITFGNFIHILDGVTVEILPTASITLRSWDTIYVDNNATLIVDSGATINMTGNNIVVQSPCGTLDDVEGAIDGICDTCIYNIPAPTNLSIKINGNDVILSWSLDPNVWYWGIHLYKNDQSISLNNYDSLYIDSGAVMRLTMILPPEVGHEVKMFC